MARERGEKEGVEREGWVGRVGERGESMCFDGNQEQSKARQ